MKSFLRYASAILVLSGAGATASAQSEFVIGAPLMFSGPGAFTGESTKAALDMLAEEANAKGGIAGRKVRIVYYDTEGKPDNAVRVLNRMLKSDRVEAVIGPVGSWEVPPVKRLLEAGSTPTVLLSSARAFVEPVSRCIFKVPADERSVAGRAYEYVRSLRLSKVAIVTQQDAYGDGGQRELKAQAKDFGMEIVADEKYAMEDTDLAPLLTRVRRTNPQVVINWSSSRAPIVLTNAYRQMGMTQPLVHGPAALSEAVIKGTGANGEGILVAGAKLDAAGELSDDDPQKPALIKFRDAYRAKYSKDPNQFAANAHDAFGLIAAALVRARGDSGKVCDELNRTNKFAGATAVFTYTESDHVGPGPDSVVVYRLQDGKWKLAR
ncbi:MAG: ABC transporter substrate-binding protein [Rubrivivax sp.]